MYTFMADGAVRNSVFDRIRNFWFTDEDWRFDRKNQVSHNPVIHQHSCSKLHDLGTIYLVLNHRDVVSRPLSCMNSTNLHISR